MILLRSFVMKLGGQVIKLKNIFYLILILWGDVSFCGYDDLPIPPPFEPFIEKEDLGPKISGVEEEATSYWRGEMNHWYDKCAQYNDETDDMPLGDKIDFFLENEKLEGQNELLNEQLNQFYPDICKQDFRSLGSLEIKKRLELEQIQDQINKNKAENKVNAEIEALKEKLRELDKTYDILHDDCEKHCYIPSKYGQLLSPIEKRKIELEEEFHSLQVELLEKKVAEQKAVIEEQDAKASALAKKISKTRNSHIKTLSENKQKMKI